MSKIQKLIYVILAIILFIVIIMMFLVHTFNNTKENGYNEVTTTKYIIKGD